MAHLICTRVLFALVLAVWPVGGAVAQTVDPLPSWNNGANKKAILDFVAAVTQKGGKDFVPVAHRIATFDMDGTLMVEKTRAAIEDFADHYLSGIVRENPSLRTQPYRAVREANSSYLAANAAQLLIAAGMGLTNAEYRDKVLLFGDTVKHMRYGVPHARLFYRPMIELIRFLEANGFAAHIVSGSEQEFARAIAEKPTGLPKARVLGAQVELIYSEGAFIRGGSFRPLPVVGAGKPLIIEYQIGKRPIFAFGNTLGDLEMLRFAASHPTHRSLALWLDHDDGAREYVYDGGVPPSPGLLKVSMKNDFGALFVGQ